MEKCLPVNSSAPPPRGPGPSGTLQQQCRAGEAPRIPQLRQHPASCSWQHLFQGGAALSRKLQRQLVSSLQASPPLPASAASAARAAAPPRQRGSASRRRAWRGRQATVQQTIRNVDQVRLPEALMARLGGRADEAVELAASAGLLASPAARPSELGGGTRGAAAGDEPEGCCSEADSCDFQPGAGCGDGERGGGAGGGAALHPPIGDATLFDGPCQAWVALLPEASRRRRRRTPPPRLRARRPAPSAQGRGGGSPARRGRADGARAAGGAGHLRLEVPLPLPPAGPPAPPPAPAPPRPRARRAAARAARLSARRGAGGAGVPPQQGVRF